MVAWRNSVTLAQLSPLGYTVPPKSKRLKLLHDSYPLSGREPPESSESCGPIPEEHTQTPRSSLWASCPQENYYITY